MRRNPSRSARQLRRELGEKWLDSLSVSPSLFSPDPLGLRLKPHRDFIAKEKRHVRR